MPFVSRVDSARQLDSRWDTLGDSIFQRQAFLSHCEEFNPCEQRYYILMEGGVPKAGAIVYSRPLDLLTYLGIPSPIRMHIVGVPASVSAGGFVGSPRHINTLARELITIEEGFLLLLNLAQPIPIREMVWGKTLPTIFFSRDIHSIEEYESSLRADYRRRYRRICEKFEGVCREILPTGAFSEEMYRAYEAVWDRSDAKLEKLSC
ncbi:hypothetical protein KKF84_16520, partial [Myxococcota bacterium]|nr:hypothetical protein [Myxococcota bacterium]MBU1536930.1 hypothetical protein [Myxococcota bacterium]